jgi:pimeloyl-ACP methyl ester carboxylesterase
MATKPALFLLPGLLCDEALWRHQAEHLGALADVTIADFTTQDSIPAMAASVLDAAPERFAMAALSMGGYVALEVMRQGGDRVERLALLDTAARDFDPARNDARRGFIDQARHGKFRGVTRRYIEAFIHPDRLHDKALTDEITAMTERVGLDTYMRQQQAIIDRTDALDVLPGIRCPTLVVCGRQDALTPVAASEEIAAGVPGAALVVIEQCGHLTTMERPQAVTALLSYWLQK